MMNTHRDASRQSSGGSINYRHPRLSSRSSWREAAPVHEEDERPHTPEASNNDRPQRSDPPQAPLDAAAAAARFARTTTERQESPSPTRPANTTADRYRSTRRQRTSLQSIEGGQMYYEAFGGRDPWDSVFGPFEAEAARQSQAHSHSHSAPSLRRHSSLSLQEIFRETLRHEPVRFNASSVWMTLNSYILLVLQDADIDMTLSLLSGLTGTPHAGGLHPSAIAQLPTALYKDSEEAKREERCPICLDDVSVTNDTVC